tara:strand:+ start:245 stop:1087 length:843 start_codon:yes stop_codon:yes gene_type:complete
MKKLLYLFLVLTILGCSSNDDNSDDIDNNDNNNILVSKISYDDNEVASYSYEENFTYELNKIVERQDVTYYNGSIQNTYRAQFIYSNDLIARVDYYDEDDNLLDRTTFQYDSQSRVTLVEECYYQNGSCENDYTNSVSYNSDGTITVSNADSNSNDDSVYTYQLDNQGNIIGALWEDEDDDCEEIVSINYDNNNTPFKNITGANLINVVYGLFSDARLIGFFNNIKSIQEDITCNDSSNNESYTTNFSYDYTQDGYPRNIVATETDGGEQYTSTIILEYN